MYQNSSRAGRQDIVAPCTGAWIETVGPCARKGRYGFDPSYMTETAMTGQWVQIHSVILKPGGRAPQVPPDTQAHPLEMWVKGYAVKDGELGQQIEVRTVTGRLATGTLVAIEPGYAHGYGKPVPELQSIGQELRRLLRGEEDCT